jgi:hypothetical protein
MKYCVSGACGTPGAAAPHFGSFFVLWLLTCALTFSLLLQADFRKAKEKVLYKKKEGVPEGLYM